MSRGAALAVVVGLSSACGPGSGVPDAGTCPSGDLPAPSVCSGTVPTYSADIAPVFASSCVSCHGSAGSTSFYPLTTYAEVAGARTSVLSQVLTCEMPAAPVPQLTPTERQLVLTWLVCGLPN